MNLPIVSATASVWLHILNGVQTGQSSHVNLCRVVCSVVETIVCVALHLAVHILQRHKWNVAYTRIHFSDGQSTTRLCNG